jgi:hypothetical protein
MPSRVIYTATNLPPAPRLGILRRAGADQCPPHHLTLRDLAIIEAVYAYRALTTPQIETLLFPSDPATVQPQADQPESGKTNRCRHRLKLLYHHGYLYRAELPVPLSQGRRPLVYFLDKRGRDALCDHYGLQPEDIDWQPRHNRVGDLFLEHLLQTNAVRVAITVAARQRNCELASWLDDRTLRKQQNRDYVTITGPQGGRSRRVALVPDGYCHLQSKQSDAHFLLELDRRTVVGHYSKWGGKDWARKVRAYIAYFSPTANNGASLYAQRYGTDKLRVLTITTGPRRLANLKRITEQVGGRKRFWFTTLDQVTPNTVLTALIWQKAGSDGCFPLLANGQ